MLDAQYHCWYSIVHFVNVINSYASFTTADEDYWNGDSAMENNQRVVFIFGH